MEEMSDQHWSQDLPPLAAEAVQPADAVEVDGNDGEPDREPDHEDEVRARLRQIRQDSAHIPAAEELEPGLRAIAAPVRDRTGEVVAAVNVSTSAARTSLEHLREVYLPALLRTTAAMTRAVASEAREKSEPGSRKVLAALPPIIRATFCRAWRRLDRSGIGSSS